MTLKLYQYIQFRSHGKRNNKHVVEMTSYCMFSYVTSIILTMWGDVLNWVEVWVEIRWDLNCLLCVRMIWIYDVEIPWFEFI